MEQKEVVIMIGYPASGKSTLIKKTLASYYRVDGDVFKNTKAMVKDAEKHLDQSIVFDSTGGTKKRRAAFIAFAQKYDFKVRAIWLDIPMDVAMAQNIQRTLEGGTNIPALAFYMYRSRFEEPISEEGFELLHIT